MRVVFHDTETTGVNEEDRILQSAIAICDIDENGRLTPYMYEEEIIKPPIPCKPEAAAVHGIWKQDYENAPTWDQSVSKKVLNEIAEQEVLYIAHNASFDISMLKKEGTLWPIDKIGDSLNMAMALYPEQERHSLQYLRYSMDFDSEKEFTVFIKENFEIERLQAHTALSDIAVLAYFVVKAIQTHGMEQTLKFLTTPYFPDKVSFGKVFKQGSSLREALLATYEQYGRVKTGLDYFSWAMKEMEGLRIDQKIGIAYHTMSMVKQGKISIHNKNITPMIYTAAVFLPQFNDILSSIGFTEEKRAAVKQKALSKITSPQEIAYIEFVTKERFC